MTKTILRLQSVKQRCGLSRTAIYAAIQRGDFPVQVEIGLRTVGWLESDIDEWIAARPRKAVSKAVQL